MRRLLPAFLAFSLVLTMAGAAQARMPKFVGKAIKVAKWVVGGRIGMVLKGLDLLQTGFAVVGFFDRDDDWSGGGYHDYRVDYGASDARLMASVAPARVEVTTITVTIAPNDPMKAGAFRLRYRHLLWNNRIGLPNGGALRLEDDGRLVFENAGFEGYATFSHNRILTVWDKGGDVVAVVKGSDDGPQVLVERSPKAAEFLQALQEAPR